MKHFRRVPLMLKVVLNQLETITYCQEFIKIITLREWLSAMLLYMPVGRMAEYLIRLYRVWPLRGSSTILLLSLRTCEGLGVVSWYTLLLNGVTCILCLLLIVNTRQRNMTRGTVTHFCVLLGMWRRFPLIQ